MGHCYRKGGGSMKLKEIKPGMVIHWKTEEEKVSLLEELERLGYIWYGTHRKPTEKIKSANLGHVIFVYNDNALKTVWFSFPIAEFLTAIISILILIIHYKKNQQPLYDHHHHIFQLF